MPASTHPSNLQRRIHAGGGRVLEQRKSTGVRIHTTPQVGADGKPAEAPHRRAHGDDYPLELRSSLTKGPSFGLLGSQIKLRCLF